MLSFRYCDLDVRVQLSHSRVEHRSGCRNSSLVFILYVYGLYISSSGFRIY
jgi:hypothetical protein